MSYDLFPAVDADFNFPEEVRVQLAKSEQLRNLVIPMTEETRDALTEAEKWVGRTIFNTTTQTLESLKDTGSWVSYLDETYSFPEPPPFWDENFDVPEEVRVQLSKSVELRNMIVPMSESERDSLSETEIWNGRTIYNTSKSKLEVWVESLNRWSEILDETYVPVQPEWRSWEPVLYSSLLKSQPNYIKNYTSIGRFLRSDGTVFCVFQIEFTDDCVVPNTRNEAMYMSIPTEGVHWLNPYFIGDIILDFTAVGGPKLLGVVSVDDNSLYDNGVTRLPFGYFNFSFYDSSSNLIDVRSLSPQLWTNGCKIYGSIYYQGDPIR